MHTRKEKIEREGSGSDPKTEVAREHLPYELQRPLNVEVHNQTADFHPPNDNVLAV